MARINHSRIEIYVDRGELLDGPSDIYYFDLCISLSILLSEIESCVL